MLQAKWLYMDTFVRDFPPPHSPLRTENHPQIQRAIYSAVPKEQTACVSSALCQSG